MSIELYDPESGPKRRSLSRQRYDDYVDTEPDGMYWKAFTPNQRDEYYERHRSKKHGHGRWMNVAIVAEAREVMAMIIREDMMKVMATLTMTTSIDTKVSIAHRGNYDVERIEDGNGDYND